MRHAAGILILIAAGSVGANEIYKWTDEDGNVHYGDRPTGEMPANAEMLAIASRRTDPEAVAESVAARQERDAARAEARSAREEAERKAADEREAAEQQAAKCAEYRARLETYVTSRRLYKLDDSGERVYLDDAQMQQARSDLQKRIEETCSG